MADFVFRAHSGLRYLVLVAGVVALVLLAIAVIGRRALARRERVAGSLFVALLDLQVLLGVGTLVVRPWFPALAGHLATMVLALLAAHGLRVSARRATDERTRAVRSLLAVVVPLLLIVAGIAAIGRRIV